MLRRSVHAVLALAALSAFAAAQESSCTPHWDPLFSNQTYSTVPDGRVFTSAVFDDGSGPQLYLGGSFLRLSNKLCAGITSWDGTEWHTLGGAYLVVGGSGSSSGGSLHVRALCVFDDGRGPALYVGGNFTTDPNQSAVRNLMRWDGSTWSVVGGGVVGEVWALAVHDDGSGAKLYAGGVLTSAGGQTVAKIARWDGSTWTPVGSGISGTASDEITCLRSFDSGSGARLYAGGYFTLAGGAQGNLIAAWDGTSWSSVGGGMNVIINGHLSALHVFDDGSGPRLYAGGSFTQAGATPANSVASWDGSQWSAVGSGFTGDVHGLEHFDDGSGMHLYAGGEITAGPEFGIYHWNGSTWNGVGGGVTFQAFRWVDTLCRFNLGAGTKLFVGGNYPSTPSTPLPNATVWNGSAWEQNWGSVPPNFGYISGLGVFELHVHDDGSGAALYATTGSAEAQVVRWRTGTGWSSFGPGQTGPGPTGSGTTYALETFDDGNGPALYAAGDFNHLGIQIVNGLVRWDGSTWAPVGGELSNGTGITRVFDLHAFDDGTGAALYVTGTFTSADGVAVANIARWDGRQWSALSTGLTGTSASGLALTDFDNGNGRALYVGGRFAQAGLASATNIARWNGVHWSALGGGLGVGGSGDSVTVLTSFDDGSGPALWAGGKFTFASGIPATSLARWNGSWSVPAGALGFPSGPFAPYVSALRGFSDGTNPVLLVGGFFTLADGQYVNNSGVLTSSGWSDLDGGVGHSSGAEISDFEIFDEDHDGRDDIIACGFFSTAGPFLATNIVFRRTCAENVTSLCAGDGSLAACPCANSGLAGRGCDNSAGTGGASLGSSGLTHPDTLVLSASGELPNALSIFLQGNALIAPVAFGDGLRCAGGALKRLYTKNASGGMVSAPEGGDASIHARSAELGDPILDGSVRLYQVYYRDPNLAFCAEPQGSSFNATNALAVIW